MGLAKGAKERIGWGWFFRLNKNAASLMPENTVFNQLKRS